MNTKSKKRSVKPNSKKRSSKVRSKPKKRSSKVRSKPKKRSSKVRSKPKKRSTKKRLSKVRSKSKKRSSKKIRRFSKNKSLEKLKIIKIGNFKFRQKIAAFDFDHTLVIPKDSRTFPKNKDDWKWLQMSVPDTLKSYYTNGYCIVVFTNQTKIWKIEQIKNVLETLNIPIYIFISFNKKYNKPNTKIFDYFIGEFLEQKWDKKDSFFVGDALGRINDWSNIDKIFAENIGINIKSPEEIFKRDNDDNKNKYNNSSKIIPSLKTEIIITVGYPASGKSTLINNIFGNNEKYVILSGDILKTSKRMIKKAEPFLKNNKSIIFDATNGTIAKRAEYIKLAEKYNVPVRCIYLSTSFEDSLYRNNQRINVVPKIVYYVYRKNFEIPTKKEKMKVITI